jgi:hypothetical protein
MLTVMKFHLDKSQASVLKTTLVVLVSCIIQTIGWSQKTADLPRHTQLSITLPIFGNSEAIYFQELAGAPSTTGSGLSGFGIGLLQPLNTHWSLETGLEYTRHSIRIIPNVPPGSNIVETNFKIDLLTLPIGARLLVFKGVFLNSGFLFDVDLSKTKVVDSQTGIGTVLGLGVQFNLRKGVSVFANPYFKAHGLIPFSKDNYPQRLIESGVRIGLGLNLPRK